VAPALGIGLYQICAEDPGIGFVSGCALRIQAWVCPRRLALASGIWFGFERVVWTFGKAL